jgi:transcriptional regulator with XRE-family HTH domain
MILDQDISENMQNYIGNVIYRERKKKKLSREKFIVEIEKKTGHKISVFNLGLIENGQTNPTLKTLMNISKGLEMDMVDMFPKKLEKSVEIMKPTESQDVLKSNYRLLSELEEHFPENSKHKAAFIIQEKMKSILNQLEK